MQGMKHGRGWSRVVCRVLTKAPAPQTPTPPRLPQTLFQARPTLFISWGASGEGGRLGGELWDCPLPGLLTPCPQGHSSPLLLTHPDTQATLGTGHTWAHRAGEVGAAGALKGPLNAVAPTGPQAFSPGGPGRPATVH